MRLICFGDSNTYGFDPRSFLGDRYSAGDRWVDLLSGWETVNEGANGRIIPRNPYVLRFLQPDDLLLVMLGTNDLLQGASASECAERMERFLSSVLPHCPHILLVAPPPMKRGAWVPTDELVTESVRLGMEYRILADRLHIPFADAGEWEITLTFDGVHFTEEGHRRFARGLQKFLDEKLPLDSPPAS